jgi:hypothetical protein
MGTKKPRRLTRMPREREKIMEAVFQGALAVIRKHKAAAAAEALPDKPPRKLLKVPGRPKPQLIRRGK